jgi:hypothetical protein
MVVPPVTLPATVAGSTFTLCTSEIIEEQTPFVIIALKKVGATNAPTVAPGSVGFVASGIMIGVVKPKSADLYH